jgi:hypothetical protein
MLTMVGLLVAQLAILSDSRDHIVAQDRKINRIVKESGPVLGELEPALAELEPALADLRPALADLRPALRNLDPALRDLPATTREVRAAMRALNDGQLVDFLDLSSQLVRGLRDSEFIPRTLRAADLVPEMTAILRETLAVQRNTLRTQRRTLKVQRQTRAIQRETVAIQRRLLVIQEEALVHIRSIDRKTGGTAPGTGTPVPAAPR